MKTPLLLATAVGLGMAGLFGAVAFEARHRHSVVPTGAPNDTTGLAPARPARPRLTTAEGAPTTDVDALLADGSPRSWGNVASLYPGRDEVTKRKVLQRIAKLPELPRVIGYVLATVGEDPTPAASDPMVDEASALLRHRFEKYDDYEYARQAMVMQTTDKRRWVVANALIDYAKGLRDDEFAELKGTLQAKLIDVHGQTHDGFVKNGLVQGLRALGGRDAALILEKGGYVTDQELGAVAEEQAAARKVLAETHAP